MDVELKHHLKPVFAQRAEAEAEAGQMLTHRARRIHDAVDKVSAISDVLLGLVFALFLPTSVQKVCR